MLNTSHVFRSFLFVFFSSSVLRIRVLTALAFFICIAAAQPISPAAFEVENSTGKSGPETTPAFYKIWGYNLFGQLGLGHTIDPQTTPQTFTGFPDITAFGGGFEHSVALRANGTVIASGRNDEGELGDGTNERRSVFAQVLAAAGGANLSNVVAVSGGGYHSIALKSDGTVWAWGDGTLGQLGNGANANSSIPVQAGANVAGFNGQVIAIDAGVFHNLALTADGKVWAWGRNFNGELGDGSQTNCNLPQPVLTSDPPDGRQLSGISQVSAGELHSAALKTDGAVVVWGRNDFGQVGNGTVSTANCRCVFFPTATAADTMGAVTSIDAGSLSTAALKGDGTVWVWGHGVLGQIGDGNTANALTPRQAFVSNVVEISTGNGHHILARTINGSVFAWGRNFAGAIGNGTTSNQLTPLNISLPQGTGGDLGSGIALIGMSYFGSFAGVPQAAVPAGTNVRIEGDNVRLAFSNVTTAGSVQLRAIDPSATGLNVPAGYAIEANSQAYDISSSAQFTGPASVCFKVRTVLDQAAFDKLTILHDDNGDGTFDVVSVAKDYQLRQICRAATSFSPFVLARALAPTAAKVSVSGRVLAASGSGLKNATVTLTDPQGISRRVLTSPFGFYRFDNVGVGETYVFTVSDKRYRFAAQLITVNDEVTDLNFTAIN
jgi:alpha-tubulin suppressor-like RCC1 family protein